MNYLITFCLVIVVFSIKARELEMENKKQKGILLASIITLFFAIIRGVFNLILSFIF